ncbi:hypothetical protein RB614_43170 [Phytohabitans sp. ZYX-F-186]|uniref:Uncharacterized protein n=1 Tax=Phytohabitans maris TaxID=3071409 RepID=A0ABU0ZXS2_9ACTN|nr:hypothetical protein [Phytohabitans sp. ZYX-F-186]MDQ7911312.1 hypothetical protein [Phytohabitans sp. ZYX-F-186]
MPRSVVDVPARRPDRRNGENAWRQSYEYASVRVLALPAHVWPPSRDATMARAHMDGMATEDLLCEEQLAVIIVAVEEATVADVMDEYRARQRWAETGSTLTPSDLDTTRNVR